MQPELYLNATQIALVAASLRTAGLLEQAGDGRQRVPSLAWTVAETAVHLVTILQHSRAFVTGEEDASRYATLDPDATTPGERSAAANARMVEEFTERDPMHLAHELTTAAEQFVAVSDRRRLDEPVLIEAGVSMTVPAMTAVLLGEQLVHGFDLARAIRHPWSIPRSDAILVVSASITMIPEIIDAERTAGVYATFELRLRGGPSHRIRIDGGVATVDDDEGVVDCWVSVDPAASLLLAYGRVGQLGQILRGRFIVGGRKLWRATKLGNLLTPV